MHLLFKTSLHSFHYYERVYIYLNLHKRKDYALVLHSIAKECFLLRLFVQNKKKRRKNKHICNVIYFYYEYG